MKYFLFQLVGICNWEGRGRLVKKMNLEKICLVDEIFLLKIFSVVSRELNFSEI